MKSIWVRIGLGALVLVLCVLVAGMVWEPFAAREGQAPASSRVYTAEIIRDDFGVPHIYGATDADVAYGVAIAHAEDDFFTLQDVAAMARGRYGAIAGQEGAQVDFMYHLLGSRETAAREYPRLPADTRALFDAYATGLNDYAAANPGEVKLDRLFPLDGEDIAAGFALRQPFFFGLANVIGPLVAGEPLNREQGPAIPGASPDGEALPSDDTVSPVDAADPGTVASLPIPMGEDAAHAGSNAFAVAPEKSGGPTILISNSHQPWRGGVAWYELVVESGEGWHYAGANFPGSPFPFLGHNEHLGWTNTVNTPDMVDVYRLEMDESGTRYRLDGEWRELETRTVTLPVKLGPIVLPVRRDVHRSVHGPVIVNDEGAFAVRYGGIGNLGQLDAYYRLNKATSFDEWQSILARMDIPSTNFIYGDKSGNIANIYNAAIPDRVAELDGKPVNWRGILPGDDSRLIWPGPVDYEALPRYTNPASGWVFEANNNPFMDAGPGSDLSQDDFAPELGIEIKDTNRGSRGWRLMSEAERLDRAALERIKYDTGYDRGGYVARMLMEVARSKPRSPDAKKARRMLSEWDFTADGIGEADALALLMIRPFMGADYQNGEWPDAQEELERATEHLMDHFGRLDPPMSDLLRLRQGEGENGVDLPLDGGSDTLRASTLWDVDDDGRLSVRHGDSFIQWVEWLPGERVSSRSIQPFGSATTRPDSPHYTDQAALFVQHKLKPVHFWREDVLAHAASRKTVTSAR
ncbi:acylase [Erythrobacteraceae bacterium WH01K]|nr:acylase [Erythrobacteraceae bacterium WH01K]